MRNSNSSLSVRSYDYLKGCVYGSFGPVVHSPAVDVWSNQVTKTDTSELKQSLTPIESLQFVMLPAQMISREFDHDRVGDNVYVLAINLHHAMTPQMRHRDTWMFKNRLDSFEQNKTIIYQPYNNDKEKKNPATLLVHSNKGIENLIDLLENDEAILGKCPTNALRLLHSNQLERFKNRTLKAA